MVGVAAVVSKQSFHELLPLVRRRIFNERFQLRRRREQPGEHGDRDGRRPWLDALSYLQIELLRRDRGGDSTAREPLLASIAALATGLRSTG